MEQDGNIVENFVLDPTIERGHDVMQSRVVFEGAKYVRSVLPLARIALALGGNWSGTLS